MTQTAPSAMRIDARDCLAARVVAVGALNGWWQRIDDLVIALVWKLASDDE